VAAGSFLALFDDIATVLDDVSIMSKVAAKKTAGVLGDDLALNAQQVTGIKADRELPVVWAVCKGSLINKAILVPAALLISAFAPWLVTPLLMLGGAYLCYEGTEKLAHKFFPSHGHDSTEHVKAVADSSIDLVAYEKEKIRGAVRTDFILSAEIIAITLGIVAEASLMQQVVVMSLIAIAMTIGVYGLVAGIVKLDDAGLYLSKQKSSAMQALGRGLVSAAPMLMKGLSVVGTVAMFMVGGGILTHGIPMMHHLIETLEHSAASVPAIGPVLGALTPTLVNILFGIVAGAVVMVIVGLGQKLFRRGQPANH
jgi:predicted DNA repair protein MutK